MDCLNYRLDMLSYLKHELDLKRTKKLLNHVVACPECREELKIQFLVMEGMKRLEYGGTFNLEEDFEKSIQESLRECNILSRVQKLILCFFYGGCILVLAFLAKGILI